MAEPFLAAGDEQVRSEALKRTDDGEPQVWRQLAASLGALAGDDRRDAALAAVLKRRGSDPIVVDAVVSGLHGRELAFINRLRQDKAWMDGAVDPGGALKMAAAAVMGGGRPAEIQQLFDTIGAEGVPRWQRLALLEGVDLFVPDSDDSGGRMDAVELKRKPDGLLAAAASADVEIRERARQMIDFIGWPQKPTGQRAPMTALSAEDQQRFANGRAQYRSTCAPCHQQDGRGMSGLAPPLVGSKWVLGQPARLARIVLHGKEGAQMMPPLNALSDDQIAAVLTYVRRAWGHQVTPVNPGLVTEVRGYTTGRNRPWTEQELSQVRQ
jgi:mono/diheme cytochrome c family protein